MKKKTVCLILSVIGFTTAIVAGVMFYMEVSYLF